MMLLAAIEDHKEIPKLSKIPEVCLNGRKIPKTPKISIGKSEYPTVLITLYKGII